MLSDIIHPDQQGFTIYRFRQTSEEMSVCLVKQVMEYYNKTQREAIVLLFDGEKAYDRQDHGFMLSLLEFLGFGGFVLDAVRTMYTGILAKLVLNGRLTKEIKVQGGVRQGCPLSCYLYIIMVEACSRRESKAEPQYKRSNRAII